MRRMFLSPLVLLLLLFSCRNEESVSIYSVVALACPSSGMIGGTWYDPNTNKVIMISAFKSSPPLTGRVFEGHVTLTKEEGKEIKTEIQSFLNKSDWIFYDRRFSSYGIIFVNTGTAKQGFATFGGPYNKPSWMPWWLRRSLSKDISKDPEWLFITKKLEDGSLLNPEPLTDPIRIEQSINQLQDALRRANLILQAQLRAGVTRKSRVLHMDKDVQYAIDGNNLRIHDLEKEKKYLLEETARDQGTE